MKGKVGGRVTRWDGSQWRLPRKRSPGEIVERRKALALEVAASAAGGLATFGVGAAGLLYLNNDPLRIILSVAFLAILLGVLAIWLQVKRHSYTKSANEEMLAAEPPVIRTVVRTEWRTREEPVILPIRIREPPPAQIMNLPFIVGAAIPGRLQPQMSIPPIPTDFGRAVQAVNAEQRARSQPEVSFSVQQLDKFIKMRNVVSPDEGLLPKDIFISYAHADGSAIARQMKNQLQDVHRVPTWLDDDEIELGLGFPRQLDHGLKARVGVAVVTTTYMTGRKWIEDEINVLLDMDRVIPVLAVGVTFKQLQAYSPLLGSKVGLELSIDSVSTSAAKIAAVVKKVVRDQ